VQVTIKQDGAIGVVTAKSGVNEASNAPAPQPAPQPSAQPSKPEPQPAPASADAYVASSRAKVFHKASCPAASKIKDENRVTFKTREEAVASGRTPAKDCNP
jgi:hypothetical protein